MKKIYIAGLLLFAACSKAPDAPRSMEIPYSATAGSDMATRATLSGDNKYLFQAGDKLIITGTGITGRMTLSEGAGTGTATFKGMLVYTGAGQPSEDLELQAVLESPGNQMSSLTYASAAYPSTAITTSLADATEKYSYLTATSTYGARSFSLSQQTSFLNFTLYLNDGPKAGSTLDIDIKNGGETLRTGSVTTETVDGKVVARFMTALPGGTTLSGASITLGTKEAVSFGGTTTLAANMSYNISKTLEQVNLSSATSDDIGKIICSKGHIHTKVSTITCGGKASAIIAHVGTEGSVDASSATYKGLALALSDANGGKPCEWCADSDIGRCVDADKDIEDALTFLNGISNTNTLTTDGHNHPAATACSNYTTERPEGVSDWFLPSIGQWNKMVNGLSGNSTDLSTTENSSLDAAAVNGTITTAGGTGIKSDKYWSSVESEIMFLYHFAWYYDSASGKASTDYRDAKYYVRSAFAF